MHDKTKKKKNIFQKEMTKEEKPYLLGLYLGFERE